MNRDAPLTLPGPARPTGPRVEARRQFNHAVVLLALVTGGVGGALVAGVRPSLDAPTLAVAQDATCAKAEPCQRSLAVVRAQPSRPAVEARLVRTPSPGPDRS